jgi:peptidoglycan/LPS O-acetylase OafA/YrhL
MSVPARTQHLAYLDGWRGLAIAFVLVAHFNRIEVASIGRLGVDFFFVLSGLLMARILFVQRMDLLTFYKRRFSRIFPAFLVFVLVVFGVAQLLAPPAPWNEFFPTLLFLRSYLPPTPDIWHGQLPIAHLWSLNVEEHSYLLMGLLTLFLASTRAGAVALLCVGLASLALRLGALYLQWEIGPVGLIGVRTETAMTHIFVSGGYSLVANRFVRWVPPFLPVASAVAGVACYFDFAPWWSATLLSPFLLAFAVNHLAQAQRWFLALLEFKPLTQLGVWSYSLYLWQQPFFDLKAKIGPALGLACAFAAGLASFYIVERPVRDRLNQSWARPKPRQAARGPA